MRVAELSGALLDYWVARAEGIEASRLTISSVPRDIEATCIRDDVFKFNPSESWILGGPVIERERISFKQCEEGGCYAYFDHKDGSEAGATALIASMRLFVRSKFGPEVEDLHG